MPQPQRPLVLASASPRRRDLLEAAGFVFEVAAVDVDERRQPGEPPRAYVERMAREKAAAGARSRSGAAVLGADTIVIVDDRVLGKPSDDADAGRMLRLLSGRSHEVLTGVALAWEGRMASRVEKTTVWMAELTEEALAWYVASGESKDKAGAYAIQGLASRFITRIEGSYSNVVGLPMAVVLQLYEGVGEAPVE